MNAEAILAAIPDISTLVVGDVCLDRWCWYNPAASTPSRETGIPRIGVVRTEVTPGAGGTVANNLRALGASRVAVLGVIGDDGFGWELRRALAERGIDASLCIAAPGVPTFTYTKLINAVTDVEDLPRVDFISLAQSVEAEIVARLRDVAGRFDVILVSDQAEAAEAGVITEGVRAVLAELAEHGRLVWVDSRDRGELFRNAIWKPNEREAAAAYGRLFGGAVDYRRLREAVNAPALVITHGERGALVVEPERETWAVGRSVKSVDICGAGDSFSAGAALALVATGSMIEAAQFGNLVASLTICKKGTGTASPDEVLAAADAVPLPIGDIFDLHSVPPRDASAVTEEYLREAHRLGLRALRIIHGRGIGVQREMVRKLLARLDFVASFSDAPAEAGGWGATLVTLK